MIIPEGEIECPECGGTGYWGYEGHTSGCSMYGCSQSCPDRLQQACERCKGYGTLEVLEVLAQ